MTEYLGKIENVYFGLGGYQDACIGIHFTLSGEGWGVSTWRDSWDCALVKHSPSCKWTEESRDKSYSELVRYISSLLSDAKVSRIDALKGKPVRVIFDERGTLSEWRILKEVL